MELPYSDIHDVLSADPTELFNYIEPIIQKYIENGSNYIANDCDIYECRGGVIFEFEVLQYNLISYSIYRPKLIISQGEAPVTLLKQLYEGNCRRWGIWENHSQPLEQIVEKLEENKCYNLAEFTEVLTQLHDAIKGVQLALVPEVVSDERGVFLVYDFEIIRDIISDDIGPYFDPNDLERMLLDIKNVIIGIVKSFKLEYKEIEDRYIIIKLKGDIPEK